MKFLLHQIIASDPFFSFFFFFLVITHRLPLSSFNLNGWAFFSFLFVFTKKNRLSSNVVLWSMEYPTKQFYRLLSLHWTFIIYNYRYQTFIKIRLKTEKEKLPLVIRVRCSRG